MGRAPIFKALSVGVVTLASLGGWASGARADVAYGYAEQTISGLTVTPGTGTLTPTSTVSTFTQDSTTFNGSGSSNSDPLDAIQAYQGGTPASPQNDFTRYAPGSPPVSPTTPSSFTRGDVVISSIASGTNSSSAVAESYLSGGTASSETGNSGLGASFSFTLSSATALAINYNFANDLFAYTTGSGAAAANYHFNITIKDASGNVVFSSSTNNTNLSLSAPPPGGEVIKSGSETVTTGTLAANATYSLIFSSQAQTSVAVVPEPASLALLAVGTVIPIVYRARRKRAA